jgi:DNA repair protein RadC
LNLAKVAEADHNLLSGTDVLEAFFYLADSPADCRQMAEKALRTFGHVGAVLSASVPDLITRLGIRRDVAYGLKAIHVGICCLIREPIRERVRIGSFTQLIDYMRLSPKHETCDVLRVLYLDRSNGLIADEAASRGAVAYVSIHPREVVKRALELGASAIIMVHNHPLGTPTPSEAHIRFSQQVERALSVMDITLHDSLSVVNGGFATLRSLGRL